MREYRNVLKNDTCTHKAIYQEGPYYIIPEEYCGMFTMAYTHQYHSLCIHKCEGSAGIYNFTSRIHDRRHHTAYPPNQTPVANLTLKTETGTIEKSPIPPVCGLCNVSVPETLRTLWTLMNLDSLSMEQ